MADGWERWLGDKPNNAISGDGLIVKIFSGLCDSWLRGEMGDIK